MSRFTILCLCLTMLVNAKAQEHQPTFSVENPVTTEWLQKNLKQKHPRLFLDKTTEKRLRQAIQNDEAAKYTYQNILQNADAALDLPVLERQKEGKRLLGVSREALRRIGVLAMAYRVEEDEKYLNRLEEELVAVCNFSDWNPSHFLDVGEMALAVAIGLDWCMEELSPKTVNLAKTALIEKALEISFDGEDYNWWINAHHNWNQVCHGGLTAAALVVAEEAPDLAAQTISRAIEKLPLALDAYNPDGAYPEGPSYWKYGTSYNLVLLSALESALGTDFGLSEAPGFMESAVYRLIMHAPSGTYFNYADASDNGTLSFSTRGTLLWFAQKTGDALFFDKKNYAAHAKQVAAENSKNSRLAPLHLIWLAQTEVEQASELPTFWKGGGPNPVAVIRSEADETTDFYLATKGGAASVNHANMDAGSFIFELYGVRWSVDPGNQGYNELEQRGIDLWNREQDSERWTLLTKNNFNHSTLTVNDALHYWDGFASVEIDRTAQGEPMISIALDEVLGSELNDATRHFIKKDAQTLRIVDDLQLGEQTQNVTWIMMTMADVAFNEEGVLLTQDGKQLQMRVLTPESVPFSVISVDPPPLEYDKHIEGLKRLELRIPSYILAENERIEVELSGR